MSYNNVDLYRVDPTELFETSETMLRYIFLASQEDKNRILLQDSVPVFSEIHFFIMHPFSTRYTIDTSQD